MTKDPNVFLIHILNEITRIEKFIDGYTNEMFYRDEKLYYAVLRSFEIIGEASKKLSAEFRQNHPEVFWRALASTRNFLIHEYYDVDLSEIWRTIHEDLPKLKKQIQDILNAG